MPVVKKLYKWTPNDDLERKGYDSMFFVGEGNNESGWLDGYEYAEPTPVEWVQQNGALVPVVEMPKELQEFFAGYVDYLENIGIDDYGQLTEAAKTILPVAKAWRDKLMGVDNANTNANTP